MNTNRKLSAKKNVVSQYINQTRFLHKDMISELDKSTSISNLDTLNYLPPDISNSRIEHHTVDQEEIFCQDSPPTSMPGRYFQEHDSQIDDNFTPGITLTVSILLSNCNPSSCLLVILLSQVSCFSTLYVLLRILILQ